MISSVILVNIIVESRLATNQYSVIDMMYVCCMGMEMNNDY